MMLKTLLSRPRVQAVFLALACIVFVVPILPAMPEPGVDSSWAQALMYALEHGFHFGRDVVFPYGPYLFLQADSYSPLTYLQGLAWGLVVACWLFRALWRMREERGAAAHVWLWVIVMCLLGNLHAFYLCVPFLFLCSELAADKRVAEQREELAFLGLSALVMALATLCKTSNAMPVFPVLAALAIANWRRSLIALSFYGLFLAVLWKLQGQQFSDVPAYFFAALDLVSGYSGALSVTGSWVAIAGFGLACAGWLAGACKDLDSKRSALCLGGMATLWLLGKSAFVRQDVHILIGATGLILVALATFGREWRVKWLPLSVIVGGTLVMAGSYHIPRLQDRYKTSVAAVRSGASVGAADAAAGAAPATFADRVRYRLARNFEPHIAVLTEGKSGLDRLWREARAAVREAKPLPLNLREPVDVYPLDIGTALAHGYQWSGRPVLQSYSAYTPLLLSLDAQHLASARAPASLVFTGLPIDNQLPSLSDGSSWLAILQRYVPSPEQPGIWVRREQVQAVPVLGTRQINTGCGAEWSVGDLAPGTALFARIDMQPAMAGRLLSFLFRMPEAWVELTLADGTKVRHRFVPSMAREGFLLSPYVAAPADFSSVLQAGALPVVRTVRLTGDRCEWLYGANIPVVLEVRDLPDAGV